MHLAADTIHHKRKDQASAHDRACTTPSPRGRARAGQARNRPKTAGLNHQKQAKKSYRSRITVGARKCTHNFAANARPHKKRKDQLPGHGPGCTRPSPRGRTRAARRRHSGARNGTSTATPRRDIFCRTRITAENRKCKLQDPNPQECKIPTRRPLCSKYHGRE